jgi:hypothetical protein
MALFIETATDSNTLAAKDKMRIKVRARIQRAVLSNLLPAYKEVRQLFPDRPQRSRNSLGLTHTEAKEAIADDAEELEAVLDLMRDLINAVQPDTLSVPKPIDFPAAKNAAPAAGSDEE